MNLKEKIENIGRGLDYETCFFYDVDTKKILWEEKHGEYDIIDVLPYVTKHDVSNAILVHNHPAEYIGTYITWSPISPADIYNGAYYNQRGIIANDGFNVYTMLRPKNGWGIVTKMSTKEFDKLWLKEMDKVDDVDKEKVKNLKMSVEKYYHKALFDRTNKLYKNLFGLSMTITPLKYPYFRNLIGRDFIAPENIPVWMKSSPKLMAKLKKEFEDVLEQFPAFKQHLLKGKRTSVPQRKRAASKTRAPDIRVNVCRMF